jgi:hypothetical protein
VASGFAAVVLGAGAVVAGTPGALDPTVRRRSLLGGSGYFAVGAVMNAVSRSSVERAIWTPAAATTAALAVAGRPF